MTVLVACEFSGIVREGFMAKQQLSRQQFIKALTRYPGVTLDTESEQAGNIQIDTPKGKIFNDNGCHTIVEPFANNGGQSWKSEAYAEVIRRLSCGLSLCESEDCDICGEYCDVHQEAVNGR